MQEISVIFTSKIKPYDVLKKVTYIYTTSFVYEEISPNTYINFPITNNTSYITNKVRACKYQIKLHESKIK